MANIHDLTAIRNLVEKVHPSAVIVVDIDVIAGAPEPSTWKTSLEKPVFLLPCMLQLELAHIRNKHLKGTPHCIASMCLSQLCSEGDMDKGVYKPGIGWFISSPLPLGHKVTAGMKKLSALTKAIGPTHTHLVMFTREMAAEFPGTPVILATADTSLYNVMNFLGISAFHFKGFPMNGIEKMLGISVKPGINWDEVLKDIQVDAEKRTVSIELTLLSKGRAPEWIQIMNGDNRVRPVIMAQGIGTVRGIKHGKFSWSLPYLSWDIPEENSITPLRLEPEEINEQDERRKKIFPGSAYLDFGGLEDTVPKELQKALVDKLNVCVSPLAYLEDMPTLQDPVSVMKQFFLFEMFFQKQNVDNRYLRQEIAEFEEKIKNFRSLVDWAGYWFKQRKVPGEDKNISFNEFLYAIRSCWNIGETIHIELINESAELSNMRSENEEK